MRFCVFAVLLSAGPVVLCQSGPATPFDPNNFGRFSSPWTAQGGDFGKLPGEWNSLCTMPSGRMHLSPQKPTAPLGDAAIDPRIVVHPPERNLGTQYAGTLVAQNLYPGLRLLPIDAGKQGAAPPAGVWPGLKIGSVNAGSPATVNSARK